MSQHLATALRDIVSNLRSTSTPEILEKPFAGSTLVLEMPNTSRDIGEVEAIARYDAVIRKACALLQQRPLGTLAMIDGLPIFLCPLVGCTKPSHAPVISRELGPDPMRVDGFEGIGASDIEHLIGYVEAWLKAPTFGTTDFEREIEAAIADVGDALFAAGR